MSTEREQRWRPPSIPKGWSSSFRMFHGYWELNCPHGVGHPDPRDPAVAADECGGLHGCDGCCADFAEILKPKPQPTDE